jgi:hypothetical protein
MVGSGGYNIGGFGDELTLEWNEGQRFRIVWYRERWKEELEYR